MMFLKPLEKKAMALMLAWVLFVEGGASLFAEQPASEQKVDIAKLEQAAHQGNIEAQYFLGLSYYLGKGVPVDYEKTRFWLEKVALQGNADAQFFLGEIYDNGEGVPQDYVKAIAWYEKAAFQGDADAQFNLGVMYYNGHGVPQDFKIAYAWVSVAATSGDKQAIEVRDKLATSISPATLALGKALSKVYLEKYGSKKSE